MMTSTLVDEIMSVLSEMMVLVSVAVMTYVDTVVRMVTVETVVGVLSVESMVTIVSVLTGLKTVWMEAVVVIVDIIVPGTMMQ
jgi:hypothetical protein